MQFFVASNLLYSSCSQVTTLWYMVLLGKNARTVKKGNRYWVLNIVKKDIRHPH